jgi:putative membrane protein
MFRTKVFAGAMVMAMGMSVLGFTATVSAADNELASSDKKFITEAAQGGLLEVKLGELASKNGTDQSVKDFGQQMVTDHTKANEQLMTVAKSKNVDVPAELDSKGQKMVDKMSKLSGADFDKAYMKDMVKDHEKDVKEFKKEAKDGKDADVKKFAEDTVPTLEHHLEMARTTAEKVGVKVGGKSGDHANADHAKADK